MKVPAPSTKLQEKAPMDIGAFSIDSRASRFQLAKADNLDQRTVREAGQDREFAAERFDLAAQCRDQEIAALLDASRFAPA